MPLDLLNIPDPFQPPDFDFLAHRGSRPRRSRTMPAAGEGADREMQEAADEAFARELQEQEIDTGLQGLGNLNLNDTDDPVLRARQRVRRQRRRVNAIREDNDILKIDERTANLELDVDPAGGEATRAGLTSDNRVDSRRRRV